MVAIELLNSLLKTMDADEARGDERRSFQFRGQRTKRNIFTFDYTNSVKFENVNWILRKKDGRRSA